MDRTKAFESKEFIESYSSKKWEELKEKEEGIKKYLKFSHSYIQLD